MMKLLVDRPDGVFVINAKLTSDNKIRVLRLSNTDKSMLLIVHTVRKFMESNYGTGEALQGYCIEASEYIAYLLKTLCKSDVRTVEGWCLYDDASGCSDRPYDEHTFVLWKNANGNTIYLDVTADQFNSYMDEKFNAIEIRDKLPHGIYYKEPEAGVDYDEETWEPYN